MSKAKAKVVEVVETVEVVEPVIEKGHGEFFLTDNSRYVGEWIVNNGIKYRNGTGVLHMGPEVYDGEWLNDAMHGVGEYKFSTGAKYKGDFKNNMFDGEGTYFFPDGSRYSGSWSGNKMHGVGTYKGSDDVVLQGEFFNGTYRSGDKCVIVRTQ